MSGGTRWIGVPLGIESNLGMLAEEATYERHVDRLLRTVLLTSPGERVDMPEFGCGLRRMVFAPNDAIAATLAQVVVLEALERWMAGVVAVHTVSVEATVETLSVNVSYTLLATGERRFLNVATTP